MNFNDLIECARKRALTEEEARAAMLHMADGAATPEEIRSLLMTPALSVEEVETSTLTGLVKAVRERMVPVEGIRASCRLDTCGTGGGATTFNISTTTAFVMAAAPSRPGWPGAADLAVCKHGNRAVASKTGSADVLEELGIRVDLPPASTVRILNETGFGFFFAQKYHPAFAHVQPVRRQLAAEGRRTAFNLVGPLVNPARVTHQVMGVFIESRLRVMTEVLKEIGLESALVVTGRTESGEVVDEVSLSGPTRVFRLRKGAIEDFTVEPRDFGLEPVPVDALRGADRAAAAEAVRHVLSGEDTGSPRSRAAQIKAAAAFHCVAGAGWAEGADLAREALASGAALVLLEKVARRTQADGA